MTITIEVPENLAARAAAVGLDPDQMNRIVTAAAVGAVTALADQAEGEHDSAALAAVVAAGREALEDERAGRTLSLEEADANLPPRIKEMLDRHQ